MKYLLREFPCTMGFITGIVLYYLIGSLAFLILVAIAEVFVLAATTIFQ